MGRPLKEIEPLDVQISFRVRKAEAQPFLDRVKKSGLTRSEMARREWLRNEAEIIAVAPKMSEPRRELLFLAKKTSNNINQIAHQLNSAHLQGTVNEQLYTDILSQLDMVMRHMKATL